jgi:beta-1,4-mannosyltransferase
MKTILFYPDWKSINPYQSCLAKGLCRVGYTVNMINKLNIFDILKFNPMVFHLHWVSHNASGRNMILASIRLISVVFKIILVKMFGIRIVWTVHNLTSHEAKYPYLELLLGKTLAYISDAVIVHTKYAKKIIINEYKINKESKIHVIPHAGYQDDYVNTVNKIDAREHLGIEKNKFVCLYFGQVRDYKGIDKLIDVFKIIEDNKVLLIMAGKPANNETKLAVEHKTINLPNIRLFLEYIKDNDVQYFMNAADVVILPFNKILTSGSLMLAMSFGKAVITPRIGAVTDVIGENGAIYFDGSTFGLKNAVLRSTEIPLLDMENENRRLANKVTWNHMGLLTCNIYNKL